MLCAQSSCTAVQASAYSIAHCSVAMHSQVLPSIFLHIESISSSCLRRRLARDKIEKTACFLSAIWSNVLGRT